MNTSQQVQPEVWYVDTKPNEKAVRLFEDKHYKVKQLKRGPEFVSACVQLNGKIINKPQAVFLGDLDDLNNSPRDLVIELASAGIENVTPFSRSYLINHDLLHWKEIERPSVRNGGYIKIVGFGGDRHQERPLVLFQYEESGIEGHFGKWEDAIRPNPTLDYQARR